MGGRAVPLAIIDPSDNYIKLDTVLEAHVFAQEKSQVITAFSHAQTYDNAVVGPLCGIGDEMFYR
ncbi:hypothetical protein AOT14_18810 [Stenotrophomonas acidaminiphila]|uniref:Uncharacterized protein n=1 Tax=Stenotrophomonas acidaminiphila TaxID=128780 RepID=A0A0S1AZV0_9GAMM|nr:hypothetical protein AOT14_18810 [Stenotrophomonas acidaminiphila]